jgi:hypothetical protein
MPMIWNHMHAALGPGDDSLELWQMCRRATVVHGMAILIVHRRQALHRQAHHARRHPRHHAGLGARPRDHRQFPLVPTLPAALAQSIMPVPAFYWSRFGT